jgi:uncharacterized protein (TIGR00251 family)
MNEGREHPRWYRWQDGDLLLNLRVQPRASRDELAGPAADHLRVRITAPPVEGKANAHLRRFLAKTFGVTQAQVEYLSGEHTRIKRLRIHRPTRVPTLIRRDRGADPPATDGGD